MDLVWPLLASWTLGGSECNQECNFSLLAHTKQLLLVPFCDMTAGIGSGLGRRRDGQMPTPYGQTDVKVGIVM